MSDYTFIQLNEKKLDQLYKLHESVYGKKVAENYYHLKYATEYTGIQFTGFLAFLDKKPVAYYGIIPVFVSIKGQKVLAAQACDIMTHCEHRKKGLFIKLAEKTFELAIEKGIHFVFGFPNQNSYHGLVNKLGFTHVHTLERYTFFFGDNLFKKFFRKFSRVVFNKNQLKFSNELINLGYDGVIYSEAYINYKSYNSNGIISRENYSAWLSSSSDIWLGAMSKLTEMNVEDFVTQVKNTFHPVNFTFMISPGTVLTNEFRNKKAEESFAVITKNLSNKYDLSNLKFQFADIDIF